MARLLITLLGEFAVVRDHQPVTAFESDQVRALLAYLALEPGRAHSRAMLADLLWLGRPEASARANLRHALSRLRYALADDDPERPLIRADHRAVTLDPTGEFVCDAVRFSALVDACMTHEHAALDQCEICAPQLHQAADLYRGPLLAGPPLSRSPVFQSWQLARRAELDRQALGILDALASRAEAAADYRQLCLLAERQLTLEPWHEPAHRNLMRGLALSGDRAGALAQYERLRTVLADELDAEPDNETHVLYERIRAEEFAPPIRDAAAPTHQLPAAVTPFVGREAELADLQGGAGARLLTLVGAGGIGKTRLALELARGELPTFADGVHFVALASLGSATEIVPTIAAALHLTLRGDQQAALLRFLRPRNLLLILDNFEHLLDGAEIVPAILEAAPQVRIIVTSRERLNVRGEQLYLVEGLGYGVGPMPVDATSLPAVRLFVQSARRVQPALTLSNTDLQATLRICRLVHGMPLGLELAATWVDRLALTEIAEEIACRAGLLEADWRDAPPRQRSMQAVFDWSWRLLSPVEQQALCRLAIFRGGWTREAAEVVAGVTLPVLTSLVRKSLARRGPDGRYEMLEPLRQLAAERPGVAHADSAARHSAYYLRFVVAQERRLSRDEPHQAVAAIQVEIGNVRQAWIWAADNAHSELLGASAYAIKLFFLWSVPLPEMVQAYQRAADHLRGQLAVGGGSEPETLAARRTLGKLLAILASVDIAQGQYARAHAAAREAVVMSVETGGRDTEAHGKLVMAVTDLARGRGEALELLRHTRELARTAREQGAAGEMLGYVEWRCCYWLAWEANRRGDLGQARRWAYEGLELSRRLATLRGELDCLEILAVVERDAGDDEAALRSLEQIWALSRPSGYLWGEGVAQHGIGTVLARQGRLADAREALNRALAVFRTIGDADREASALASLIQLYIALHDAEQARACMAQLDGLLATGVGQYNAAQWELVRALVAECGGDAEEALAAAERARSLAQQTGQHRYDADALGVILRNRGAEHVR